MGILHKHNLRVPIDALESLTEPALAAGDGGAPLQECFVKNAAQSKVLLGVLRVCRQNGAMLVE